MVGHVHLCHRFVGLETLPGRLTDFDLQQFFQLGTGDVEAVRQRFRSDRRVAGALQLLFLRACGRLMDRFAVLPRNLRRNVAEALHAPPLTIASLRSLHERRPTLYEHQQWARDYLGLRDLDPPAEAALVAMLALHAAEAAHADELVTSACHWLYDHRIPIPGERCVQDWARDAFAAIEASVSNAITSEVSPSTMRCCLDSAHSQRPGAGCSRLEWIQTPSKRHGPSTLAETVEKISYLKSLGVHEWQLPELLLEIDAQCNYSEALLGHRAETNAELLSRCMPPCSRASQR